MVLPREVNRARYDAIVATCRDTHLSPTLVEIPDGQIERALLAVAAGAAMGLVPDSVPERYAGAGVQFVPRRHAVLDHRRRDTAGHHAYADRRIPPCAHECSPAPGLAQ